ncbi:phage tail tape measure protein [Chakrabartyella piscis]|uniref:phage tail tape measure protein n=1 Tax=Chakrabartyella piscis TaxID=2918914 RepID=UPI002958B023|nr:phage tail tape measure protein [Chakrabartyella piscis]
MSDGSVIIKIKGDDSDLSSKLTAVGTVAKKAMAVTVTAITAASTAMVALGGAAVAVGTDFETSMAKASTLFGDVEVDIDNLESKILEVSSKTGVAATEMGNSLYNALSAGIPVTEDMAVATEVLEKSAMLAKAGFTDVDTALTAVAKTMNAYGQGVESIDDIQKVLMQTQNLGITTVDELGQQLASVTPTAAAFGVSFEQVGASLANMTSMGTATATATTQLNGMIAELGKSGTTAATALENAVAGTDLAGKSFTDLMDEGMGLNEVLDLMGNYAESSGKSLIDMFSSTEAGQGALALSGDNSAKFASNLEAMGTSADVVGEAYEKMDATLASSTEKIKTTLTNLGIAIYQSNEGIAADIVGQFADIANNLSEAYAEGGFSGLAEAIGTSIVEVLDMAVEYAPTFIEAGVSMIQSFLSGLTDGKEDIADGAIAIITTLAEGIIELLPEIVATGAVLLASLAGGIAEQLPELIPVAVDTIAALVENLCSSADLILEAAIELITSLGLGLIAALPNLIAQVPEIVISIADVINNNASKLLLAALQLILQLGLGLIQNIPTLIANIPTIIEAIVKAFFAFQWISLGGSLTTAIANGVKSAGSLMVNAASSVSAALQGGLSSLPQALLTIGKNLITAMVNGIKGGIPNLVSIAKQMSANVVSGFLSIFGAEEVVVADTVEDTLGSGVVEGIEEATPAIANEVDNTGDVIVEGMEDSIDEVEDLFTDDWTDGITTGIDDGVSDVVDSVEDLGDAIEDAAQTIVDDSVASITEAFETAYDEIISKQEDMQKKLSDTGDLFSVDDDTGKVSLLDFEENIKAIEAYDEALTALEQRGIPEGLMDEILDMDMDDATMFAEELLAASDSKYEAFVEGWTEQQEKSKEIAEKFYAEELALIEEEFIDEVEDTLSNMPGMMEDIGNDAIAGWVDGMEDKSGDLYRAVESIANQMIATLKASLSIHSPSKRMEEEIGVQAGAGVEVGFTKRMKTAYRTMQASVDEGIGQMGTSLSVRGGNTNTNVVNNTNETKEGDVNIHIEKMTNDGNGSTTSLLQEAEFYRKQRTKPKGSV